MSLFSKQILSLEYADIEELLVDQVRENIRLEYKREAPGRFETVKKLSSFANTYGGYLVIGAEEDGQGQISGLPGLERRSGYNQQVTQWCYDRVYPPLNPLVSNPIDHPSDPNRVFYVVYVSQSYQAPHFLNDRKGCYIRTDEFSQRFEAELAKYEEIRHLADRRIRSVDLRERILTRSRDRLEEHINQNYRVHQRTTGRIDTTLWLSISPLLPEPDPFEVPVVQSALSECQLPAEGMMFPSGLPQTQVEGFYFPDPIIGKFSYLEVDVHGHIFYAEELGHVLPNAQLEAGEEPEPSQIVVYLRWIFSPAILFLRYAARFYRAGGYDGLLQFKLGVDQIRGRRFRISFNPAGDRWDETRPMLDDSLDLTLETDTRALQEEWAELASKLFRAVTFSCGWGRAYTAEDSLVEAGIDIALGRLGWSRDALPQ